MPIVENVKFDPILTAISVRYCNQRQQKRKPVVLARRAGENAIYLVGLGPHVGCEVSLSARTVGAPRAMLALRREHAWTNCRVPAAIEQQIVQVLADFDETDHPRYPTGDPHGGEFAPKDAAGGATGEGGAKAGGTDTADASKPEGEQERPAELKFSTPPPLPADWKKMDQIDKDRAADAAHTIPARFAELTSQEKWPSTGNMHADVSERVAQCADLLAPEASRLIVGMAQDMAREIEARVGAESKDGQLVIRTATDALIAQETEAAARTLTDHGVHHLLGDAEMAIAALRAKGTLTDDDRLTLSIAATFHDCGYLTPPARNWQDKDHPHWSMQYYDDALAPAVTKIMGQETSDRISHMIATHSETDMDWKNEPETSALRLGDSLAVFQQEKDPPLLRYVPENRGVVERWANGELDTPAAQAALRKNIDDSKMPPGLKSQMTLAVGQVNDRLPKFVGGLWSGEITSIDWDKRANTPVINVLNKGNDALMKRLDLGQSGFEKLAETYGKSISDFKHSSTVDFKSGSGKQVVARFVLHGRKLLSALIAHFYGR